MRPLKLPTDAFPAPFRFREWIQQELETRVQDFYRLEAVFPAGYTPDTEMVFPHRLGRPPRGFRVTDQDADSNPPYRDNSLRAATAHRIYLKSPTAGVTFQLELF